MNAKRKASEAHWELAESPRSRITLCRKSKAPPTTDIADEMTGRETT